MKRKKIQLSIVIIVLIAAIICIPTIATSASYSTNKDGQTYGTLKDVKSSDEVPDLIRAVGIDGNIGYLRSSDLPGVKREAPEKASSLQAERDDKGAYTLLLYANDGKTVLGVLPMGSAARSIG